MRPPMVYAFNTLRRIPRSPLLMPEFAPPVLPRISDYGALCRNFRWEIPGAFNIAVAVCDRWAERDPRRTAILHQRSGGRMDTVDYGWLRATSNPMSNPLRAHGITRGDRVALLLPQMPEVAAIHVGIYKLAAIALPLAALFGPDAISYRLENSGAKALITDEQGLAKLAGIRKLLPALALVLTTSGGDEGVLDFHTTLARAGSHFAAEATSAHDPAMMIYTSGTTGPPKGALEPHRVLLGHLPGVEFVHEFFPQAGDLLWTPAARAWAVGLLNVLLPARDYGRPVVARRVETDPQEGWLGLLATAE